MPGEEGDQSEGTRADECLENQELPYRSRLGTPKRWLRGGAFYDEYMIYEYMIVTELCACIRARGSEILGILSGPTFFLSCEKRFSGAAGSPVLRVF